ncbi:hypothetical protein ACS127_03540 [Amphibacillus sp. Q70]|uniref:hypothetical protein n=1 Tax=Amphibacillus sp. Q70 TaxID=3453416 RepID=UPI003F85B536
MDWIVIVFFSVLAVSLLLIVMTLASLPQLGDERKNFIKMKAQSYTFAVTIFYLLIRIGELIYVTYWTDHSFRGENPFILLFVISIIYLITLLFTKKRYGG